MRAVHLAMLGAVLSLCVVCSPENDPFGHSWGAEGCISDARVFVYGIDCVRFSEFEQTAAAVAADSGLKFYIPPGTWAVRIADGDGSIPITDDEWDAGYRVIYARNDRGTKTITLRADWELRACHELIHIPRGIRSNAEEHVLRAAPDGGQACVSGWFCDNRIDLKCREAAPP